jgi:hypothetical protein
MKIGSDRIKSNLAFALVVRIQKEEEGTKNLAAERISDECWFGIFVRQFYVHDSLSVRFCVVRLGLFCLIRSVSCRVVSTIINDGAGDASLLLLLLLCY